MHACVQVRRVRPYTVGIWTVIVINDDSHSRYVQLKVYTRRPCNGCITRPGVEKAGKIVEKIRLPSHVSTASEQPRGIRKKAVEARRRILILGAVLRGPTERQKLWRRWQGERDATRVKNAKANERRRKRREERPWCCDGANLHENTWTRWRWFLRAFPSALPKFRRRFAAVVERRRRDKRVATRCALSEHVCNMYNKRGNAFFNEYAPASHHGGFIMRALSSARVCVTSFTLLMQR